MFDQNRQLVRESYNDNDYLDQENKTAYTMMNNSNTNSMSRIGQNMVIMNMKDASNSLDSSTNFADAFTATGRDDHSASPLPYRLAAYRNQQ